MDDETDDGELDLHKHHHPSDGASENPDNKTNSSGISDDGSDTASASAQAIDPASLEAGGTVDFATLAEAPATLARDCASDDARASGDDISSSATRTSSNSSSTTARNASKPDNNTSRLDDAASDTGSANPEDELATDASVAEEDWSVLTVDHDGEAEAPADASDTTSTNEENASTSDAVSEPSDATNASQGASASAAPVETSQSKLAILATDNFGRGNQGRIGEALAPELKTQLADDIASGTYARPASQRWICVDGRSVASAEQASEQADPQTAGGWVITNIAADLMLEEMGRDGLTTQATRHTEAALRDGLTPVVHGDSDQLKAGCGANQALRASLKNNDENVGVVSRLVWQACQWLSIDQHVSERTIARAIQTGKLAAENEDLWDATPEQLANTIMTAGGQYEELSGTHSEAITVLDFSEQAFAKQAFASDHASALDGGRPLSAFAASLGALKTELFRQAKLHGDTERAAAERTMAALIFNIGLCKQLSSDSMSFVAIGQASPE